MGEAPERRLIRRIVVATAKIALPAFVALVGIELVLRLFAAVAVDRGTAWRPGAVERILCVGDSHTYGAGVRSDEAYPARLQEILDREAPGVYSVVNRGIPGFNSGQLRRRLPGWIADLAPTIVIVIVGTNNVWNLTDAAKVDGWTTQLRAWALRLRLVRFVEAWRAGRAIDLANVDESGNPFGDRPAYAILGDTPYVDVDGVPEPIDLVARIQRTDLLAIKRAAEDYEAMANEAAARHVRLVFLGYPARNPLFVPFSDSMRLAARRHGLPFVDGVAAIRRVPRERRTWTFGMHAGPDSLVEIARDLAAAVRQQQISVDVRSRM